jgi:hypothetical protein
MIFELKYSMGNGFGKLKELKKIFPDFISGGKYQIKGNKANQFFTAYLFISSQR